MSDANSMNSNPDGPGGPGSPHRRSAAMRPADPSCPMEPWEDGFRTNGLEDAFEWWYFDSIFEDGTSIVIIYKTKEKKLLKPPLTPSVSTTIKSRDGSKRKMVVEYAASELYSSTETCDVRIGPNRWRGDIDRYEIHNEGEGIVLDLTVERRAPAWRPHLGLSFIDAEETLWSGWVVPVPHGAVKGTLLIDGETRELEGTCYHDHNWGNVNLGAYLDYWYWGRGHVGDFTLVFSMLTGRKSFGPGGREKTPHFYLARDGVMLTDDAEPLTLLTRGVVKGPAGKTYPRLLDWHWHTEEGDVNLALRNVELLDTLDPLGTFPWWQRPLIRLFARPFYYDFHATLELTVDLEGVQERAAGSIIFEKMMFR